jgi:uncharacterized protein (DUF952 family)
MPVYKIFRAEEMAGFVAAGVSAGAPVDLADGYIHLSAPDQVAGTAARHFAGEDGLWLVACDPAAMGEALRWEVSRGGARFPHLYRTLRRRDVLWARPLPLTGDGHVFPEDMT